jgi:transcriptional regulator with XRE-family HTH domain
LLEANVNLLFYLCFATKFPIFPTPSKTTLLHICHKQIPETLVSIDKCHLLLLQLFMEENILFQISNKLKEVRQQKNTTLQELADKANVSKSLISQIENSRTVPSLPVLLSLISGLSIDLNVFFQDIIGAQAGQAVIIKRKEDFTPFTKENARGFHYQRITSFQLNDLHVDVVLLTLEKKAKRPMVRTKATELKYVLRGKVEYTIGKNKYLLNEGDVIYFDANELHNPKCLSDEPCQMLVFYFFNS